MGHRVGCVHLAGEDQDWPFGRTSLPKIGWWNMIRPCLITYSRIMLQLQQPGGSFRSFFFDRYSPIDSSATVLAGILFVKAYEFCPNERFKDAAVKVQNALMKMTRRDGTIDFAQGDTKGVGMYSSRFQSMPFVQGMTLYFAKLGDQLL